MLPRNPCISHRLILRGRPFRIDPSKSISHAPLSIITATRIGEPRMASPSSKSGLSASPPTFSVKGAHNSLLLEMTGLGQQPASGRLLRGLTPYLDEQGAAHVFLLTERKRREPWAEDPKTVVAYQELVHWERGKAGGIYRGVCAKGNSLKRNDILQAFEYEPLDLIEWAARRLEAAVVSSHTPLSLDIQYVEKPWGREGWYTGIEARGVSRVRSASGTTELPYALGMFPVPLIGEREDPLILLKTLEPLPEPVYGDLYLEVHREKWETYVVLDVDPEAWPEGQGCLRAGLDAEKAREFEKEFGRDWPDKMAEGLKAAILGYETIRREIDGLLDQALEERGEDTTRPVAPELHMTLLSALPENLRDREAQARSEVESFLGRTTLRPGDVAVLPPGVLHSLQHGVRVIEFQTPTYERLIAMFAQKVLTQPHWDVDEAVALMEKAPYIPPQPQVLEESGEGRVERIVDFPQFQVDRVQLPLNSALAGRTEGQNRYLLLFVTKGKGELLLPDGETHFLEPDMAYLVPACLGDYRVEAISAQGLTFLRAVPALSPFGEQEDTSMTVDEVLERTW